MKKIIILTSLFILLSAVSCSKVIPLDNNPKTMSGEKNSTTEYQDDSASNEFIGNEDPYDSNESSYNDQYEQPDQSIVADETIAPPIDTETYSDYDISETSDSDNNAIEDDPVIFDEGFTLSDCGCGSAPEIDIVCCDGNISVYNPCFANCFDTFSNICETWYYGACENSDGEQSDDEVTDDSIYVDEEINDQDWIEPDYDIEIPDTDTVVNDCIPEDVTRYCCPDGSKYISECLAQQICSSQAFRCD